MRRKRRRRPVSVPVASMGDIAFLLIIFFLVCSNFAKEAGIRLKPPRAVDIDKLDESQLSVSIDKNNTLYVQGKQVGDAAEVEAALAALMATRKTDAERLVMFKCDREVDKAVFEPVLDAIAKAGGVIGAIGEKQR